MSACSICSRDDSEQVESFGERALAGEISWRRAAELSALTHHMGLKNHMEKHWINPIASVEREADEVLAQLIRDSLEELKSQMTLAPAEVKPLYAVAIRNLAGLSETKPSQQHLIAALKSIHEVTGMRMEQQMMLAFAKAHFGGEVTAAPAPALALEAMTGVLEAEVVERG